MSNLIAVLLTDQAFLIADLCNLIGSYLIMIDDDRIKFMFSTRDKPEIYISNIKVVEELDESLEIAYSVENDQWQKMTLLDRIESLDSRIYYVAYSDAYKGYSRVKTEYSLFSLLRDMKENNLWWDSKRFVWRDLFNPRYSVIGRKLRDLWVPSKEEIQRAELMIMQSRETLDDIVKSSVSFAISFFFSQLLNLDANPSNRG